MFFTELLTIKNFIFIIHEFIIGADTQHIHQHFRDFKKKKKKKGSHTWHVKTALKQLTDVKTSYPFLPQMAETRWRRPWSWAASKGVVSSWTAECSSHCFHISVQQLLGRQMREGKNGGLVLHTLLLHCGSSEAVLPPC